MPRALIDMKGQKIGRLTVIEYDQKGPQKGYWICRCDCGKTTSTSGTLLRSARSRSCGCLNSDVVAARNVTHGLSKTSAYRVWCGMKKRCYTKSSKDFPYYGGRGITVCERWLNDYAAFFEDMGDKPPNMSLDRIDNDAGYSPSNCQWADKSTQMKNRRSAHFVTVGGDKKNLCDAAREAGISPDLLSQRLSNGWDEHTALTRPVGRWACDEDACESIILEARPA